MLVAQLPAITEYDISTATPAWYINCATAATSAAVLAEVSALGIWLQAYVVLPKLALNVLPQWV